MADKPDQTPQPAAPTVRFIAPDGSGWSVPADKVAEAESKGWRAVSQDEAAVLEARKRPSTLGEMAGAVGLGVARTVTPFIPYVTPETLGYTPTKQQILEEGAGVLTAGTEAAALIASMPRAGAGALAATAGALRSGRLGAAGLEAVFAAPRTIGRASGAVGEAVGKMLPAGMGRTARFAVETGVQGGLEMGYLGGVREIERQRAGNEDLNVEAIGAAFAKEVPLGLGLGAAGGAALSGAGGILKRGARKIDDVLGARAGSKAAAEAGEEIVTEAGELMRIPPSQRMALQSLGLTRHAIGKIGPEAADLIVKHGMAKGRIWSEDTLGNFFGDNVIKRTSRFNREYNLAGKEVGKHYERLEKEIGKLPRTHSEATPAQKTATPAGIDFKNRISDPYYKELGRLNDAGGGREAAILEKEFTSRLQHADSVKDMHEWVHHMQSRANDMAGHDSPLARSIQEISAKTKEALRHEVDRIDPTWGQAFRASDAKYAAFAKAHPHVNAAAARAQGGPTGGVTPTDVGIAAAGPAFGAAAGSVAVGTGISATIAGARATHRALQANPDYWAARARHAYGTALDGAALKQRNTLSDALRKAMRASEAVQTPIGAAPARFAALQNEYDQVSVATSSAVGNPTAFFKNAADRLATIGEADPAIATKLARMYSDDALWLHTNSLGEVEDTPLHQITQQLNGKPAPLSTKAKIVRMAEILGNPIFQFLDMEKRPIAPETAQILRERRPQIRAAIEREFDKGQIDLAVDGKVMPYTVRVQASLAVGKPYDSTMRPEAISFYSQQWAARSAAEPSFPGAPKGPGRPSLTPKSTRERTSRFNTPGQNTLKGIE
jgi:hypothetical protein